LFAGALAVAVIPFTLLIILLVNKQLLDRRWIATRMPRDSF